MRFFARQSDPRCRGSVHSLRCAYNHFMLVEPFFGGDLYFKRVADRPVCVYVIEEKLFTIASELHAFAIVPAGDGLFHLKSARDGLLYSLGSCQDDDVFVPAANRTEAKAWETFELCAPPLIDYRERAIIKSIDKLIDRKYDADFLATLDEENDVAVIGACLATASPVEEMQAISDRLMDHGFARKLEEAFPQDVYARAFRRSLETSPAKDFNIALGADLWRTGLDGGVPSLPFAVNCQARHLRQPTKRVCVLATLRNEAPYIVEWLAYHRSIGIEQFFIYENDSQDGSRELVDRLADHGLIDIVHNVVSEGGNAQSTAYMHALSLRPELLDFEWCVIIDLDEFLLLNDESYVTINDFLDTFIGHEADAIAINWIVYGPDGHLRREPGRSLMDRFTWRPPETDRHIKSIVRPRAFFTASAHYPHRYRAQPFAFVDPLGRPHIPRENELAWSAQPDESRVSLAHYVCKSLDEFLLKWSRNRGDNPRRLVATNEILSQEALESFVELVHQRGVGDARMRARSARAADEARRIRLLPGIAEIEAGIEERYERAIGGIREMFLDCPAARASEKGEHFRALIRLAAERSDVWAPTPATACS